MQHCGRSFDLPADASDQQTENPQRMLGAIDIAGPQVRDKKVFTRKNIPWQETGMVIIRLSQGFGSGGNPSVSGLFGSFCLCGGQIFSIPQ